jgi:hypothetical protein
VTIIERHQVPIYFAIAEGQLRDYQARLVSPSLLMPICPN